MARRNGDEIGMLQTGCKMPPELIERIDRFARSLGKRRAETIRQVLGQHVPVLDEQVAPPRRPPWE